MLFFHACGCKSKNMHSEKHHYFVFEGEGRQLGNFGWHEIFFLKSSSFVIRVNLLHPSPPSFLYGLLLSLWCFPILVNYYFQVFFNSKGNFGRGQNNSNYSGCEIHLIKAT